MNHVTHLLSSANFRTQQIGNQKLEFHRKSANFAILENTDIDCILVHNF